VLALVIAASACAPPGPPPADDAASPDASVLDARMPDARAVDDAGPGFPREEGRFTHPASTPGAQYAGQVAISGDATRVLIGSWPGWGMCCGFAIPLTSTSGTWTEETYLRSPDMVATDSFGVALALDGTGTRALVGAPYESGVGGARVFVRGAGGWAEEAALHAPADGSQYFGGAVALSTDGSVALVGAPGEGAMGVGNAHVLVRRGTIWGEAAVLFAADGEVFDAFGRSVSLSGDGTRALIGVPSDGSSSGNDIGSARVFVHTAGTWTEEAVLVPAAPQAGSLHGVAVALSGDGSRALVGASAWATGTRTTGAAHVFVRVGTTWTEEATLLPADIGDRAALGHAVALNGDGSRALVGAPHDPTTGGTSGSARVFSRVGASWTQTAVIALEGAEALGSSVALSADGQHAIVGAPFAGDAASGRGGALAYFLGP
jgi:hypothetical protein